MDEKLKYFRTLRFNNFEKGKMKVLSLISNGLFLDCLVKIICDLRI